MEIYSWDALCFSILLFFELFSFGLLSYFRNAITPSETITPGALIRSRIICTTSTFDEMRKLLFLEELRNFIKLEAKLNKFWEFFFFIKAKTLSIFTTVCHCKNSGSFLVFFIRKFILVKSKSQIVCNSILIYSRLVIYKTLFPHYH